MNGQTQSIIVYRNPMEQAFWEGTMNFGNLIPMLAGMLVFLALVVGLSHIIQKKFGWRPPQWTQYVMWGVSIAGSIATMKWLWL
jgi:hypothetical protein